MMTGGDAVHHALRSAGVECVFGVPSQHNLGIYDALCRHGDIRVVGARHEQGAVHAADGYARATGRLGVAIVSTGPGTANAMNGLYEAGLASSPVLLVTTQVDTPYVGRGRGYIHDADQQLAMLRTVTRCAERAMHVSEIASKMLRVIADIQTGRPQPGAIETEREPRLRPLAPGCTRSPIPAGRSAKGLSTNSYARNWSSIKAAARPRSRRGYAKRPRTCA